MIKKKVVIIEDDPYFRKGLVEFLLIDSEVESFPDPDAFAEMYVRKNDLKSCDLIVIDYHFDRYTAEDKDFLNYIRKDLSYTGKVVLWTLEDDIPKSFLSQCDIHLPKKMMRLGEIYQCLEYSKN